MPLAGGLSDFGNMLWRAVGYGFQPADVQTAMAKFTKTRRAPAPISSNKGAAPKAEHLAVHPSRGQPRAKCNDPCHSEIARRFWQGSQRRTGFGGLGRTQSGFGYDWNMPTPAIFPVQEHADGFGAASASGPGVGRVVAI